MTKGDTLGSLDPARLADVPFLDEAALDRIIDNTGLTVCADVSRDRFLTELNSLVCTTVHCHLRENASLSDVVRLRKALIDYVETAKRLQRTWHPAPLPEYQWYREAIARLDLYEREIAAEMRSGPKSLDLLRLQFVPQLMGLFEAAFGREPVSTMPALADDVEKTRKKGATEGQLGKLRERGATVKFMRSVLEEVYRALKLRPGGDNAVRNGLKALTPRTDKVISEWIREAKRHEPLHADGPWDSLFAEQRLQDHSDWRPASQAYQAAIRKLSGGNPEY